MSYLLICQNCGTKHFTNGSDISNLVEVKSAPLPKTLDGKNSFPLPKKFKCYNCGFVFKTVKLSSPKKEEAPIQEEKYQDVSDEEYLKQWENEVLRSNRKKTFPPPG